MKKKKQINWQNNSGSINRNQLILIGNIILN